MNHNHSQSLCCHLAGSRKGPAQTAACTTGAPRAQSARRWVNLSKSVIVGLAGHFVTATVAVHPGCRLHLHKVNQLLLRKPYGHRHMHRTAGSDITRPWQSLSQCAQQVVLGCAANPAYMPCAVLLPAVVSSQDSWRCTSSLQGPCKLLISYAILMALSLQAREIKAKGVNPTVARPQQVAPPLQAMGTSWAVPMTESMTKQSLECSQVAFYQQAVGFGLYGPLLLSCSHDTRSQSDYVLCC
jgi:hypothetical protein